VIVVADEQNERTGTVEWIVRQYAENEHRTGLIQADKVGVVEQLSLLKASAAQIAKRTRMRRSQVDQALAVTRSDLARAATVRYELTPDQAAAIAQFDTNPDKPSSPGRRRQEWAIRPRALYVTLPASPRSQPRRVEITRASDAGRTIREAPSSRMTRPPVARGGAG
jgi:hypothetical protein